VKESANQGKKYSLCLHSQTHKGMYILDKCCFIECKARKNGRCD
jgi:hypothetical protein